MKISPALFMYADLGFFSISPKSIKMSEIKTVINAKIKNMRITF